MRMNSISHIPMGLGLDLGKSTIKPDAQGELGYASPRIELNIPSKNKSFREFLGGIFANEYPKHVLYHTTGNLGLSVLVSKGIIIFPSGNPRLSITGARVVLNEPN